jgi:pantoate--beta-alanine ligase
VQEEFQRGERDSARLIAAAKEVFSAEPGARLDYFEITDPETLEPLATVDRTALAAVAAFAGPTRLIDNIVIHGGLPAA